MHRALALVALLATPIAPAAFAATVSPAAQSLRDAGIAQLENERPIDAEASFRALIKLLPGEPLGPANLAVALLRQQKNDAALAAIGQALALDGKRADLLAIQADVLKWSGKLEEALTALSAASAAAPDDVEVLYQLYRHAGTLKTKPAEEAAARALQALARLRPENLVVMLRQGSAAIAAGDRAAATGAFLRVKELMWQAPGVAGETLGKVLDALAKGDLEAARVPALRLENVLKVTPMYQGGQRELALEIQGIPILRFSNEPPPAAFGPGVPVSFGAERLAAQPIAAGGLAAADVDGDEKADLLSLAGKTLELRRAANGGKAQALAPPFPAGARLLAVDLDNDGQLDLLGASAAGTAFARGDGKGGFADATAAQGLGSIKGEAAVAFDVDIEGDLDFFIAGAAAELLRNALTGPLEPVGKQSLPANAAAGARDAVASDLDRDGDLDLLVATDRGLVWLDNLRQGKLADRSRAAGLAGLPGGRAVVSADLDNDGLPDLAVAGDGLALFRNRGGRFEPWKATGLPPAGTRLGSVIAFDADNDGRLDLATSGEGGLFVLAQRDGGAFERLSTPGAPAHAVALAAADLDDDGDLDLAAAGPEGLFRLTNEGGNKNRWLRLRLRGLTTGNSKNNALGLGSVVEVKSGAAYQFREAAGDAVHFGLGKLKAAEVVRVVWTNGVPQNRLGVAGNQAIVEEQLLKGSCPFLYAWNGDRVDFVTDLLWGAPLGLPVAPGAYAAADPRELVAIPGAQPRAGAYELKVTEELWEAAFFDEVRLWVVDHPAEVEVASSLKIVPGSSVPEAVLGARELRPVAAAWDGRGEDATAAVRHRDEIYADGYEPSPYQGVARPWSFTFDLGEAPARPIRLFLDGWIFPADASLNLAVAQRPDLPYLPPRLEVETAAGWEVLLTAMGHPAGKTKTMVVDVPALPPGARRLRITTSLWLGWDRIAWSAAPDDAAARVVARLAPAGAELAYRGFSRLGRVAPNGPHRYDYATVSAQSPWLPFPGHYTRYGDVRPLLERADDRAVILAPGDELALRFATAELPALAPGWVRSVFLESFGWDKDADRNTYEAAQLEPLPFGAMSGYPYGEGESYPEGEPQRTYRREWLTRAVGTSLAGRSEQSSPKSVQ